MLSKSSTQTPLDFKARAEAPNDPKLRDSGVRRDGCRGGSAGAASVTHGAILCSAWLGVAVIWLKLTEDFLGFGGRDAVARVDVEAAEQILLKGNPLALVLDSARPSAHRHEVANALQRMVRRFVHCEFSGHTATKTM